MLLSLLFQISDFLFQGMNFSKFTVHMFPGIIITSLFGYGLLRLYYRNMDKLKNKDPPEISGRSISQNYCKNNYNPE